MQGIINYSFRKYFLASTLVPDIVFDTGNTENTAPCPGLEHAWGWVQEGGDGAVMGRARKRSRTEAQGIAMVPVPYRVCSQRFEIVRKMWSRANFAHAAQASNFLLIRHQISSSFYLSILFIHVGAQCQ